MVFPIETKELGSYDVIVAGGGIAGTFAATSAARSGGKVLLVESSGCLGGTLTSGSVPSIMDEQGKGGMLKELFDFLNARGMTVARFGPKVDENGKKRPGRIVDVEGCKYFLEQMVLAAGVELLYYSRVAACQMEGKTLRSLLLCTEAGNYTAQGKVFIDATGNGNLAGLCGCRYEWGEPGTGRISPASTEFFAVGFPDDYDGTNSGKEKREYSAMLEQHGIKISAEEAGIVRLPAMKEWDLSIDYQYQVMPDDIRSLTNAAVGGRKEVFTAMEKHKTIPGYENLWLTKTADHLGIREGRRVMGHYRLTLEDIVEGRKFDDGICLVRSSVDLHKIHEKDTLNASRGIKSKPYEIPYRCLIAADCDNLLLAGRCLSGDFYPHASYRMMGNMGATGEAAGFAAMYALQHQIALPQVPGEVLRNRMAEYLG